MDELLLDFSVKVNSDNIRIDFDAKVNNANAEKTRKWSLEAA